MERRGPLFSFSRYIFFIFFGSSWPALCAKFQLKKAKNSLWRFLFSPYPTYTHTHTTLYTASYFSYKPSLGKCSSFKLGPRTALPRVLLAPVRPSHVHFIYKHTTTNPFSFFPERKKRGWREVGNSIVTTIQMNY